MQLTVTCDGVPIGTTELAARAGLRAGYLASLAGYVTLGAAVVARRLGVALLVSEWRRVPAAVAARAIGAAEHAAEGLMPRLGLRDEGGGMVPVVRLYLVELPRRSPRPGTYVVADLGEAGAGRVASLAGPPVAGPGAARPAA